MNKLLRFEEFMLCVAGVYLFSMLPYSWWVFPLLLLVPDVSMIGYMCNSKIGAVIYNVFHTRIIGIITMIIGWHFELNAVTLAGIILFSHAAMDRMLHYGLKYQDSFTHTHLGNIVLSKKIRS